jgi:HD-like signal output (HDOD) protein
VVPACDPILVAAAAGQVLAHFHRNQPGPESFPSSAARIIDVLHQREPDFNKLVHMLGQDAAITARLLQVASSARYGGDEVHSVRAAALKLGLRQVGEIALGVAGRSLFEPSARSQRALFPERFDALFHDSMTSAFSAASLSLAARVGYSDRAFLAGMLHDIGKPVALQAVAALHLAGQLDSRVVADGIDDVVERVHVQIGATMTQAWSLAEYLRVAAARHHDSETPAAEHVELHLCRIVDGLSAARTGVMPETARTSAAALGLDESRLRVAATEHADLAARVTAIFGVPDPMARAASAAPSPPPTKRHAN